ncbi:MAG: inositol monophosphatase family protein [Patescibacteria group bacterium]
MNKPIPYGPANEHLIGTALKEIVRRVMNEIWRRRIGFVGQEKINEHKPDKQDRVTDADFAAQEIFVRKLTECFPGYGIVAEEHGFSRQCTLEGVNLFFTVDPLDGTKAFERRQSQGFGPMLSLCTDEKVIAAFVGDSMTQELYYYRPGSDRVHRLNFGDHQHELLSTGGSGKLADQYVLLRDNPLNLPRIYSNIAQSLKHGGMFKEIEIAGGGIGTGMARLWKGEVGGYVIKGGIQQPWDLWPVWGISEKLGFVWMRHDGLEWRSREMGPSMTPSMFAEPSIIIHGSQKNNFLWAAKGYSF